MSHSKIIDEQIDVYRRSFRKHGDSADATFAGGREAQYLRFERIMMPLLAAKSPCSVHDVGAGLCDLRGYLLDQGIEHQYSATEVVTEMAELSRKKYVGIAVYERDILSETVTDRHDFVVLSGVFNIPGRSDRSAWKQFVLDMVSAMYEMSTVATSFNFLTTHRTYTNPDLFYLDPAEILDYCIQQLSRFVVLDLGYPLFECTATVFKPEFVRSRHAPRAFDKYFKVTRLGG